MPRTRAPRPDFDEQLKSLKCDFTALVEAMQQLDAEAEGVEGILSDLTQKFHDIKTKERTSSNAGKLPNACPLRLAAWISIRARWCSREESEP